MKVLLDANTFLWWTLDDPHLSPAALQVLKPGANALFLSVASAWELVIKVRLGKLRLPDEPGRFIREQLALNRIEELSIRLDHVLQVGTLPDHHRDPFDRILIAQSLVENLPILTSDPIFAKYGVEIIW